MTRQPPRAAPRAIAAPMPRLAPVTRSSFSRLESIPANDYMFFARRPRGSSAKRVRIIEWRVRYSCRSDALVALSRASEREREGTHRASDGEGEGLRIPSLDHPHPVVVAAARRRLPLPLQSAGEGKTGQLECSL